MITLWLQLRSAAEALESTEMARVILQLLDAAADDEMFRALREHMHQDEARFLAAADGFDLVRMSAFISWHCRALFGIRNEGWPLGECDEVIAALKRASESMDTPLMVDTFERLLQLCQSEARLSIRKASLQDIHLGSQTGGRGNRERQ